IPDYMHRELVERGTAKSFFCPNGHSQHFSGETEAHKLRRQLDWERSQRRTAEDNLIRTQSKLQKIERRTSGGVCPCCNRSFVSLGRHMKTKHPDFAKAEK